MNELHLFAGAGGGILGGQLLGHRTVCAVEWEPYAQAVLVARQNDGCFPPFPIWDDVQTFDGKPWRGIVDVVAGGFPCQDISVAGKGAGIDGERSGMWGHMARVVGEVRPRFVFVENSPALVNRGLGRVLGELSSLGYDSRWIVMGASDVGANHKRDRIWILANSNRQPSQVGRQSVAVPQIGRAGIADQGGSGIDGTGKPDAATHEDLDNPHQTQRQGNERTKRIGAKYTDIGSASWWSVEPDVDRVANGVAHRTHRLAAIGNGQVPLCAATAWKILSNITP